MPVYTFRCANCDQTRDVMVDLKTAQDLELICTDCGGSMSCAPVLTLNIIGPATRARKTVREAEVERIFKPCGHRYQCRCGVRLTKSNPFKQEIKSSLGFTDED